MGAEARVMQPPRACGRSMLRARLALKHGLRLAKEAGRAQPSLKDAVWELLMEAADTLARLPNRERGWLTATSRAHWPAIVRDVEEVFNDAAGKGPRGSAVRYNQAPATAEAIDRMDVVLVWLVHAGGRKPQRDVAVLFGLACGIRVAALRSRFGCGRRTIYDIRDRALGRLCAWLSTEVASGDPMKD